MIRVLFYETVLFHCGQFHFKLSGLKYEDCIHHPTHCHCALADFSALQQLSQIAITTFLHLSTSELGLWIFLDGYKHTRTV